MTEKEPVAKNGEELRLDDARRVKSLTPGMMVLKRFLRNRLAIAGIIILVFMFLFSFVGGIVSPYRQDQVFYKTDRASKEYASAVLIDDYRFVTADGETLPTVARAEFNRGVKTADGDFSFSAGGVGYRAERVGDGFYLLLAGQDVASVTLVGKIADVKPLPGVTLDDGLKAAALAAAKAGEDSFTEGGVRYTLSPGKAKSYTLSAAKEIALTGRLSYDAYDPADEALIASYAFRKASQTALAEGADSFQADGVAYTLDAEDAETAVILLDGRPVAGVSRLIINPVASGVFLPIAYKQAVSDAIAEKKTAFDYVNPQGETERHTITMRGSNYILYTEQETYLIDLYAPPSRLHPLGTDDHGMDMLTRLMYGGRISLLVGFVVMLLETLIGIVVGGVSGYFGGWVDTLCMRFVDLFNSIPYYPMMIIAGAIMDAYEVNPYSRIFMLMAIMGIMGWTGVARVVRGQILSLREQDFMIATEATGIRVSRRIFRHLVPNVMPLLIVQATMGLGSIILTEATLSFLGLGIKYPLASWGSIINSASNIYVMTNYWYIWIPAGILIVLTVLGFNFVGDGLRDAFDPRMKR